MASVVGAIVGNCPEILPAACARVAMFPSGRFWPVLVFRHGLGPQALLDTLLKSLGL